CRRLIPFALCILYVYEPATDELEASYAVGENATSVHGLKIVFGQRVSGWVAANRQTIINSDPMLDLGETARAWSSRLRSCLSTPFVRDDQTIGVLTFYSSQSDGFNENHRRIAEAVARHATNAIRHVEEREHSLGNDPLANLPKADELVDVALRPPKEGSG